MLKNKMLVLLLSGSMVFLSVGCNSDNNNEIPSAITNGKMEKYIEQKESEPKYDFEKYNILTFGEIEIDNTPDYEGDTYINYKNKVTNNSPNVIIKTTVRYGLYDEEGTLIDTDGRFNDTTILENQSFYMKGAYDIADCPNIKTVKIVEYEYYIGETCYTVDLINNSIEIYE